MYIYIFIYSNTYIYTMLLVSRHAGAITFSIFWILVVGRLFWHLDFQNTSGNMNPEDEILEAGYMVIQSVTFLGWWKRDPFKWLSDLQLGD